MVCFKENFYNKVSCLIKLIRVSFLLLIVLDRIFIIILEIVELIFLCIFKLYKVLLNDMCVIIVMYVYYKV